VGMRESAKRGAPPRLLVHVGAVRVALPVGKAVVLSVRGSPPRSPGPRSPSIPRPRIARAGADWS
jgi:hypothetical protein